MSVVLTIDFDGTDEFMGIWPGIVSAMDWFHSEYPSYEYVTHGMDNDVSFMGSHKTYVSGWYKYKSPENIDTIVQYYVINE